jgi:hypothetical protein
MDEEESKKVEKKERKQEGRALPPSLDFPFLEHNQWHVISYEK